MGPKYSTSHMSIPPLPPPPPTPLPPGTPSPDIAVQARAKMTVPPPGLPRLADWQDHPAWSTGMQFLEAYHHWVEDIVMPIAFQWIYENYDAIYQENPEGWGRVKGIIPDHLQDARLKVSRENRDDMGVVIARAFQLVQELDAYKIAQEKFKEFQKLVQEGNIRDDGSIDDTGMKLNPIWSRMTHRIRESTEAIFRGEEQYLDGTAFPDDYS